MGANRKRNADNNQTEGCHGNSNGYVGRELKLFGTSAGTPQCNPSCASLNPADTSSLIALYNAGSFV
jgi:hypothetical protein